MIPIILPKFPPQILDLNIDKVLKIVTDINKVAALF